MSEPKPFASLSPSLLARKGAARPAMRPQIQPIQQFHEATARQMHEDLGWNDMGHDLPEPQHEPEPVAEAAPREAQVVSINGSTVPEVPAVAEAPAVVRQQEDIVRSLTPSRPAPVAAPMDLQQRRSALSDGRRAAFTLRLDAERHLQLRLACTLNNRSAQQIVTEAVDRLLAEMPDVAALASKVRKRG